MNTLVSFARIKRVRRMFLQTIIMAALCICPACGRDTDGPPLSPASVVGPAGKVTTPPGKTVPPSTKNYKLVGIVKGLNKEAKEVRIRHEEIPGFMGAMTMPFRIKDPHVFDDLRAGDKVEGKLRVEEADGMVKEYELSDLVVTEERAEPINSPAQELVVSLAGGSPTLRVKPKTLQIGEVVPDFTMTGQDGKTFKLSDLRGDVVALTFVYTRCPLPDFCPLMDRKFSELAQRIVLSPKRADKIRLISLSFDPEHDTAEVLKQHATIRGAIPPLWSYAVASHVELAKIAPKLGLVYGPGQDEIIHNLCTAIIDPQGKLARLETGTTRNKWEPTDILKTLYSLIPASGS